MPTVIMPDGTQVDMPDQLDAETGKRLRAFLQSAAPKEQSIYDQLRNFRPDFSVSGEDVKRTLGDVGRGVGLLGRGAVQGATAIPGIMANGVTAAYNLATGGNQQMPTEATTQALNSVVPPPQNTGEQLMEGAGSMAAGMKMPMPQIGAAAPPATATGQSLQQARGAGYVVPPIETSNQPGFVNRLISGLLGKKELAVEAAAKNRGTLAENVMQDLPGVPPGTEPSHAALEAVRNNVGQAYDAIKSLSPQFAQTVDDIKAQRNLAMRLFKQNSQNYNVATEDAANQAWDGAQAAENKMADALKALPGNQGQQLYKDFTDARTTIAKTYDVERALIESKGQLNPASFERAFANQKPQSGAILDAGRTTQAFPAAMKTNPESGSVLGFGALGDSGIGLGAAGASYYLHDPKYLAGVLGAALARKGGRAAALSGPVQDLMAMSPDQQRAALANLILRGTTAAGLGGLEGSQ